MTELHLGERERKRRSSLFMRQVSLPMAFGVVLAIVVLRVWVVETAIVEGHSMQDTLQDGDAVLVLKPLSLKRMDIVVLTDPQTGDIAIKRVVGLPGEIISISLTITPEQSVYINGNFYDEPYAKFFGSPLPPITIPEGGYFVMGDNRGSSVDSRQYGPVPRRSIHGVGIAVIYPFRRMHLLVHHGKINRPK